MNRIWKYVKQVEKGLPEQRRIRIAGELHATLKAKKDELKRQLGRSPTEAEVDAMLADYGSPEQVAARFVTHNPAGSIELVERYLAAVERRLPDELPSNDILAELREALTAKIEAREDKLGRSLTVDELSETLKAFGNPDFVAYRYHKRPYLIGPELAPYFWTVQRIALGVMLALTLVRAVVNHIGTTRPVSAVFQGVGAMWEVGLFTFGLVTLIFLAVDRWGSATWSTKGPPASWWNPRLLPAAYIRAPKSLFESLFGLVFDGIFILWWIGAVDFPNTMPGPGEGNVELHFSPSWAPVWWPILIIATAQAIVHLADVVHPGWSRLRAVVAIIGCAVGVGIVSYLLSTGDLIEATVRPGYERSAADVESLIGLVLWPALFFLAVVWAIEIAVEVSRLVRSRSARGGLKPA